MSEQVEYSWVTLRWQEDLLWVHMWDRKPFYRDGVYYSKEGETRVILWQEWTFFTNLKIVFGQCRKLKRVIDAAGCHFRWAD